MASISSRPQCVNQLLLERRWQGCLFGTSLQSGWDYFHLCVSSNGLPRNPVSSHPSHHDWHARTNSRWFLLSLEKPDVGDHQLHATLQTGWITILLCKNNHVRYDSLINDVLNFRIFSQASPGTTDTRYGYQDNISPIRNHSSREGKVIFNLNGHLGMAVIKLKISSFYRHL